MALDAEVWSSVMDSRCAANQPWRDSTIELISPIVSSIGIVGNLLMFFTIRCGQLKESPYVYLKCIALADIGYLLAEMSLPLVRCEWCQFTVATTYYLQVYYWFAYAGLMFVTKSWHNFLTVAITIERFIYVQWPMNTRSWCTRERAKKVCLLVLLLSLSSEPLKLVNSRVGVAERKVPKPEPEFWVRNFHCAPNINRTESKDRYRCHSPEIPVHLENNETDTECSSELGESMKFGFDLERIPKTNQSLHSVNCLHQFCRVPQMPSELEFRYNQVDNYWNYRESVYKNKKIMLLSNKTENDSTVFEDELAGRAMFTNGSCTFVLAPYELESTLNSTLRQWAKKYGDKIHCPFWYPYRTDDEWQRRVPLIYGRVMLCVRLFFTGVLTVVNVLIVLKVRRANQIAKENVLSNNTQNTSLKRRAEENRLTVALISLSCIRILTDVVLFTSAPPFERLFYVHHTPPGNALYRHRNISNFLHVAEKSSAFYLLAFMNRKFNSEFLQHIVYGKLRMHKLAAMIRRIPFICPRRASESTSQKSDSRSASGQGRTDRAGSKDSVETQMTYVHGS